MVNRHTVIREMHIDTTIKRQIIAHNRTLNSRGTQTYICEDVKGLEPSYTAGGDI